MNILFLICPTDFLETILNSRFKGRNYFYTSLGNNIQLEDESTVGQIKRIIEEKEIQQISIVLKENNTFFDPLNKRVNIISSVYQLNKEITKSKVEISKFQNPLDSKKLCISNFLNRKLHNLQRKVSYEFPQISVNAILYNENQQKLISVKHDLISQAQFSLN